MSPVLMDTDIAIDYLRGEPAAVAFVQKHEKEISSPARRRRSEYRAASPPGTPWVVEDWAMYVANV